jgi:hypothetical protein
MQNNALIYKARSTQEFFKKYGVWVVEWLPYLLDLNPIKHL